MLRSFLMTLAISGLVVSIPSGSSNADSRHLSRQVKVELPKNVADNFDRAETALLDCDEGAFNRAMNNLREQQESLEKQAKQKNITPWNTEEQMAKAHGYAENIAKVRKSFQAQWKAAQPCGKAEETKSASRAGIDYESRSRGLAARGITNPDQIYKEWEEFYSNQGSTVDGGASFESRLRTGGANMNVWSPLATEVTGLSNTRAFNFGNLEEDGRFNGFDGEFRLGLGEVPNWIPNWVPNMPNTPNVPNYSPFSFWDFFFGLSHYSIDINDDIALLETGGRDLLLVGNGGGPSPTGFVIGAANSDITNLMYDAEYDFGSYEIGLGRSVVVQNTPNMRFRIRPFAGVRYGHYEGYEMLQGTTNSGTLDFLYHSDFDNSVIGPFVGTEFAIRPSVLESIFGGAPVELGGLFRYGYDFNDFDGNNTLAVSGAVNQTGTVDLDNDDGTHNFNADLSLTLFPDSAFNVGIGAGWQRVGNTVNIGGDGTGPFRASFEETDNFYGALSVGAKF